MPSITSALAAALLLTPALSARLFASHFSGTVYSLTFERGNDSGNGTLAITSTASGCGDMPSWLTLDRTAGTLYCFDESYGGGVVSSFDVGDGTLKSSGQASTGGNTVHGWLYGDGFVATAEYSGSSLTTYALPLTSSTQPLNTLTFTMSSPSPDPRQEAPHPHAAIADPTGQYLLVLDLGADLIRIFSTDDTSGELTTCDPASTNPGDGPRHGTWWTPTEGQTEGTMLYTINELSNTITSWEATYPSTFTAGCLTLNKTQTLSTLTSSSSPGPGSAQPIKAAEVHVRDNFLYATNRNDALFGSGQDSIVTYHISATGELGFVEATNSHAWYPRTFSINKAGTLVAVGGQTSANVAVIARDAETGRLGELVASLEVGEKGRDGMEDGLSAVVWDESSERSL